jgi:hypothetical protein
MQIVAGIVPRFVLPISTEQFNFHSVYTAGNETSKESLAEVSLARQNMAAATQHGEPAASVAAIDAYLPKLLAVIHAVVSPSRHTPVRKSQFA